LDEIESVQDVVRLTDDEIVAHRSRGTNHFDAGDDAAESRRPIREKSLQRVGLRLVEDEFYDRGRIEIQDARDPHKSRSARSWSRSSDVGRSIRTGRCFSGSNGFVARISRPSASSRSRIEV